MKHINHLQEILLQHFSYNKARLNFITNFILGLIKMKTVCLSDISLSLNSKAKKESNYRRIQDFFSDFEIDFELTARFVIRLLPQDRKFIISLDRTNWQFGKTDINILMLAIVYRDTSIPLLWELLNKRGNSSTDERIELVEKAIKILGKSRIKSLVADREFLGRQWLRYLNKSGKEYHIRIRKDSVIQKYKTTVKQVISLFDHINHYHYVIIPQKKMVYDQLVYVSGNRTKDGEYFILKSNINPEEALGDYKQRWTIEKLFGYFKTKGFNFEQTNMTNPIKIKKLIALLTIAFLWSYLVGVWIDDSIKIKIKNHGRKELSLFRKGFDHLRYLLQFVEIKCKEFNFVVNFYRIRSCLLIQE